VGAYQQAGEEMQFGLEREDTELGPQKGHSGGGGSRVKSGCQ
jgi:hypothetical protein